MTLNTLAVRLDDTVGALGLPRPTHIKLDVDGMEPAILAGGEAMLADPALKSVLVEFRPHGPEGQQRIDSLLTVAGFAVAADSDDGSDNRLYVRQ